MTAPQRTIGIIGSAIAGPTLAVHILSHPLLRCAFKPVLYDQTTANVDSRINVGASVGLYGNGLYPLFQIGLRDDVLANGVQYSAMSTWQWHEDTHRVQQLTHHHKTLYSEWLGVGVTFIERFKLQQILVERARELGAEIHWGAKVTDVTRAPSGHPQVTFVDGSTITPDMLVGADGGFSRVRKYIIQERYGDDTRKAQDRWLPEWKGLTALYGIAHAPKAPDATAAFGDTHIIWLDSGFVTTGPGLDGTLRREFALPESAPPSGKEDSPECRPPDDPPRDAEPWQQMIVPSRYAFDDTVDIIRRLKDIKHPYHGSFEDILNHSDRIIRTSLRQTVWRADEIQNGTDAGTGFAIEDATVLAGALLKFGVEEGDGVGQALQAYTRARARRSKQMGDAASFAATYLVAQTKLWRWLRNFATGWQPESQDMWFFKDKFDVDSVAKKI